MVLPPQTSPLRETCVCERPRRPLGIEKLGIVCSMPWCMHGVREFQNHRCVCDDFWRPSNRFDVHAVCDSFSCISDLHCERILDMKSAKCPWNEPLGNDYPGFPCDCGWERAGLQNWEGQCMDRWLLIRVRLHQYRKYWVAPVALFILLIAYKIRHLYMPPEEQAAASREHKACNAKVDVQNILLPQFVRRILIDFSWSLLFGIMLFMPR
eukprot:gnl/TRDRNA2_/TRDRNA2_165642_c0_seq3.p1 gnl/TRDRNA2_/TRDRNA2_165642_c0~~gnl/TRDRNA2_/TRDRNA2_165642_c0_seq3.p1  ORF type:complete len:210 (-),score=16.68 gnl/TRDRNA2_/TRDRNA2_165642_c0_seq3:267-896(-)